ncbi:hypothetical protein E4U25_003335 [Claviceps purpurea]|nr:hypothetical protein E4U25_003335 [Claviceps purpurea]
MFRWLVNAIFLALPIGSTIGVLLGIQALNSANGKPPPLSNGDKESNSIGIPGLGPIKAKDSIAMKCDDPEGIYSKAPKGLDFSLSANPWGWEKGTPGNICLMVNLNGNQTYPTKFSAPPFNVTWQYPRAASSNKTNNVHAFPNAKVMSKAFPVKLGDIKTLEFDVNWHLSLKNDSLVDITDDEVAANTVNANVAIDIFVDPSSAKASKPEKASHEIMVWMGRYGTDTYPIGKKTAVDKGLKTKTLQGTDFYLYYGVNKLTNQKVLSWVASEPVHDFKGDLQPLLDEIFAFDNADYPSKTDYLGYFAFGQEAYSSDANVTFSVPSLLVDLETS